MTVFCELIIFPSATKVTSWENLPLDEIRDKYDHVFDASGTIVENLESFPYEINQEEVELFDAEENKIARRRPLYHDEPNKGAILINLDTASQMFTGPSNDDIFNIEEEDGNEPPSPQLRMYPLAFLGHYGQLQSNSILPAFCQRTSVLRLECAR